MPEQNGNAPTGDWIDAESANRILHEAARLDDSTSGRIRLADLRVAALDAGISAEAFDAAVAPALAQAAKPQHGLALPEDEEGKPRWASRHISGIGAMGVVLGALSGWLNRVSGADDFWLLLPLGAVGCISMLLAARHRRTAGLIPFLRDHLALWAAALAGVWVSDPIHFLVIGDEVLALIAGFGFATGVVGSIAVSARFQPEAVPTPTSNAGGEA